MLLGKRFRPDLTRDSTLKIGVFSINFEEMDMDNTLPGPLPEAQASVDAVPALPETDHLYDLIDS